MLVSNVDIDVKNVTSIEYDSGSDVINIEWEQVFSDKSSVTLYGKFGPKAVGLKRFINAVIDRTTQEYNNKISLYDYILEKLE